MSSCKCKWELYEQDSAICEECKELLEHPKELAKELNRERRLAMTAYELKEELKKGKYIIAAFGNISLWNGIDRERTIHPNVFRALVKRGVLHEECIESGASEFTLKTPTEKEILEARVEELEMFLTEVMKGDWKGRFNDWIEKKYFHGEQR